MSPNATTTQCVIAVDHAGTLRLRVYGPFATLAWSLLLADNSTIDASNLAAHGGSVQTTEGRDGIPALIDPVVTGKGLNVTEIAVPNVAPQQITLSLTPSVAPTKREGILVEAECESSPVIASAMTLPDRAVVGKPVVIALALADGQSPRTGATVSARLVGGLQTNNNGGNGVNLTLHDDGVSGDGQANDGIYSVLYTPVSPGVYHVSIEAAGTAASGNAFRRTSGCSFEAIAPSAHFNTGAGLACAPSFITTQSQPPIVTRFLDHIDFATTLSGGGAIHADAPGQYMLRVHLRTAGANPHWFMAIGYGDLAIGNANITATLSNDQLKAINEDGQWKIDAMELYSLDSGIVVDRVQFTDLWTPAFLINQAWTDGLHMPAGADEIGDWASDENADGLNDRLNVGFKVTPLYAGPYQYYAELWACNTLIATANGSVELAADQGQEFVFWFPGCDIGKKGINGPYEVRSLRISGPYATIFSNRFHTTSAYGANEFACYKPCADFNHNGQCDACEITAGSAPDANFDGIPDGWECPLDANHDGFVTGDDFDLFIERYFTGNILADITGPQGLPSPPDGVVDHYDFDAFLLLSTHDCAWLADLRRPGGINP